MKKLFSVLLATMLLLTCIPLGTMGVSAETEGDYVYSVYNEKATITKYVGAGGDVVIPDVLDGYPVVSLGYRSFSNDNITTIVVPESVTHLESEVFSVAGSLTSIELPENIKELPAYVFNYCEKLSSIIIPESVEHIGYGAFRGCESLTSLEIPENVTTIDGYAFSNCAKLTSLNFGSNVKKIGENAFSYCDNLTAINVAEDNPYFLSEDGVLYDKNKIQLIRVPQKKDVSTFNIPSGVISICEGAFAECECLTTVIIPDTVTSIGSSAFEYCKKLNAIEIPDSVDSLGRNVFTGCEDMRTASVGKGITTIRENMFLWCYNLVSVTLPDSIQTIEAQAFAGCEELASITIPAKVTKIASDAFDNCSKLEEFDVAADNTVFSSIDGVLFSKDKSVLIRFPEGKGGAYIIPDSTTTIGEAAFYFCAGLTSIVIPDSITEIPSAAFYCCDSLTSIDMPDTIISIGASAFGFCNFTSITLPESILYLESGAFYHCYHMEYIGFPKSIISVGEYAFYYCSALKDVWYTGTEIDKSATVIETLENEDFINATWHYSTCTSDHTFSADCDKECNLCEWTRSTQTKHTYSSICDADCDICDTVREDVTHSYTNACDTDCNTCGAVREMASHDYDNACDTECNVCGDIRTVAGHNYAPATCTTPKTCSVCGATDGKALGHKYTSATCTKAKTCKYCGKTSGKKLGHTYSNDCDKSCNRCKASRTVPGHDYEKKITKATLTKDGVIKNVCEECGYTSSKTTKIYKASKISLSKTSYTYNGKAQKPSVVVKDSKGKTISSKYYTVTYASGRKNVGTYKVIIKFKGNYSGTKTLTFKVNPVKTTVKATAAKKSLKLTVSKKSTQVTGYEVQYSTSKSFKSYKSKWLTSYKKTSLTLTGLKAKTTYYVRVRTYKTVSGKKYYSGWSTIVYKKTK